MRLRKKDGEEEASSIRCFVSLALVLVLVEYPLIFRLIFNIENNKNNKNIKNNNPTTTNYTTNYTQIKKFASRVAKSFKTVCLITRL